MVDLSTQLIHSSRLGELLGTVTQMLHRTRDERSLNMILYSPGKGSFCFYLDMRLRPSLYHFFTSKRDKQILTEEQGQVDLKEMELWAGV
jgi:hypothetical protein